MGRHKDVLTELQAPSAELRKHIGDTYAGFRQMHQDAFREGALSTAVKELIALAIGIHEGCDGCIASHARSAARAGATPEQVAEMVSVTILMGGGPAAIYGPRAWEAYQEFAATD